MTRKKAEKKSNSGTKEKKAGVSGSGHSPGWLFLIFVSAFMFVMGVMVGRNTAPVRFDKDDLEAKLAHLKQSVLVQSSDATAAIEKKLQKNNVFGFYDKLKETSDHHGEREQIPVKKPRYTKPGPVALAMAEKTGMRPGENAGLPGHEKGAGPVAQAPASGGGSISETDLSSRTESPGAPAANESLSALSRQPAAKSPVLPEGPEKKAVSSGRQYAIQVASLKDTRSAERIKNKFREKGYPSYIQEAVVRGRGQWYRVRIGPYTDKSQAESDLSRLQQAGVDAILFLSDTGLDTGKNSSRKDENENNKG